MIKITVSHAAKLLGVHPNTVRRWEKQGKIQASRTLGGWRLFTFAEINRVRQIMGMEVVEDVSPDIS